jgi:hypothetical protein
MLMLDHCFEAYGEHPLSPLANLYGERQALTFERVGVRGAKVLIDRNPSPGAARRPLPQGAVRFAACATFLKHAEVSSDG